MERRFGRDFGRIRIHTDPPAARASAALGAEAFTVGHHIAFAGAGFLPDTAQGKRLLAHELTHAVQQAGRSPHIALSPKKGRAAPAPGSLKLDGVLLGTDRNAKEVRVKREVGGTRGYDDRLQAIAVARLAQAEPAVVALGLDGKWHALEATAELAEIALGPNIPFVAVHTLPSRAGIDPSRQRVADLEAKLAKLDAMEQEWKTDPKFRQAVRGAKPPFPEAIQEEREKTLQELTLANGKRASLILGVRESEIQFIRTVSGRTPGKVNIVGSPAQGSSGGQHGPVGGQTGFEAGLASAFTIDLPKLDDPAGAQTTLFHEVQHLKDWEFTQEWIKRYQEETKRTFVKEAPGLAPFREWLDAQVKRRRLTSAEMELVIMQTQDASAYTEARANVRTFLAALQAGATDVATRALVAYAHALKPKSQGGGGQYASPAPRSQVQAALVVELKTAYRQMPKHMQQHYDAAVAAAKKEYPGAWISELDFAKRAGR